MCNDVGLSALLGTKHGLVCRHGSVINEANPYLSPLLEPPTLPADPQALRTASQELQPGSTRPKPHNSKEAIKQLLAELSVADALQCITQFLRTDKR